jgi:hypothetical protein
MHIDRVACAWLITHFIDRTAKLKFVKDDNYKPARAEVRFDMFGGEFTHIGDRCSFEVLMESFSLKQKGLRYIAEIIHDLDLQDTKFNRPETVGIGLAIDSIVDTEVSDAGRLEKVTPLLNSLFERFQASLRSEARA